MTYILRNNKLINLNLVGFIECRTQDMKYYIVFSIGSREVFSAYETKEQRDFDYEQIKNKLI